MTGQTTALTSEQQKDLVLDAIVGMGVPPTAPLLRLEQIGYIYWTGDQYNVAWKWDRLKLAEHAADELLALYMELKYASE